MIFDAIINQNCGIEFVCSDTLHSGKSILKILDSIFEDSNSKYNFMTVLFN